MNIQVGDIIVYNGYKAEVKEISYTDNGFGITYIEGPKTDWEDWVTSCYAVKKVS